MLLLCVWSASAEINGTGKRTFGHTRLYLRGAIQPDEWSSAEVDPWPESVEADHRGSGDTYSYTQYRFTMDFLYDWRQDWEATICSSICVNNTLTIWEKRSIFFN